MQVYNVPINVVLHFGKTPCQLIETVPGIRSEFKGPSPFDQVLLGLKTVDVRSIGWEVGNKHEKAGKFTVYALRRWQTTAST